MSRRGNHIGPNRSTGGSADPVTLSAVEAGSAECDPSVDTADIPDTRLSHDSPPREEYDGEVNDSVLTTRSHRQKSLPDAALPAAPPVTPPRQPSISAAFCGGHSVWAAAEKRPVPHHPRQSPAEAEQDPTLSERDPFISEGPLEIQQPSSGYDLAIERLRQLENGLPFIRTAMQGGREEAKRLRSDLSAARMALDEAKEEQESLRAAMKAVQEAHVQLLSEVQEKDASNTRVSLFGASKRAFMRLSDNITRPSRDFKHKLRRHHLQRKKKSNDTALWSCCQEANDESWSRPDMLLSKS